MPFQKTDIDFSLIKSLSVLVTDYLANKSSVKPFFSAFPDEAGFLQSINNRKSFPVDRKVLTEVLIEQNAGSHAAVKKNIELLAEGNTFTVTTGHQLNLFTGPLYFVYKILTTISLAQKLNKKFPENNFVPVYWMASEDHDIDEINHTYIYGKKIAWNTTEKGAAGRLTCEGMDGAIEEAIALAGGTEHAKEISSLLLNAYKREYSLSKATRILVDALFGKYGLVILDADDARLKKNFVPVLQDDLMNQSAYRIATDTIHELEKLNYEIQVQPREINLFYLQKNSRERIVHENGQYKVLNSSISWNCDALMRELNEHPDRFSPNVMLRPLYQETVLPNIAYIGGPAEIAYWLEYKKIFAHYKLNFPLLVLRNCVMIIDDGAAEKMKKLHLTEDDLFKSFDELAREFVRRNQDAFSLEEELAKINAVYDSLAQKTMSIDPTLSKSVEGERQKQLNALKSLEEKTTRALKKKHEVSLQQIQKLKDKFFPGGILQERQENFISFYTRFGNSFFDEVLNSFDPPAERFQFLAEKVPVTAG